ncbi:hypothetical protein KM043_000813 [Ampulex compressa]|nr:hypothetical protein KM043_000813 [Ampulex compressa]
MSLRPTADGRRGDVCVSSSDSTRRTAIREARAVIASRLAPRAECSAMREVRHGQGPREENELHGPFPPPEFVDADLPSFEPRAAPGDAIVLS